VKNFSLRLNESIGEGKRLLSKVDLEVTPEKYVNNEVLTVKIQTKYALTNLSWWCTEFSNHSLKLQLNFTDPMEVS